MHRRCAAAIAVTAVLVLGAAPALGRRDPAPAGLPLPPGLRLVDARAGTSATAYVWTATFVTRARLRDMERYRRFLAARGFRVLSGPGAALTFRFRRWQAFACADPGCAAPRGRFTLTVAVPGG